MTLVEKAKKAARAYHAEVHMEDPTGDNCGIAVLQAILADPSIVEIEVGAEFPKYEHWWGHHERTAYNLGRDEMLHDGWVKEKKDGGGKCITE